MAANLGELKVLLGADSSGLVRDINSSILSLKSFAAAAAAAAPVLLIKSSMELIDIQSKLARQIGATVTELQTLTRAGDLAGISTEEMATNMQQFNRRLGDAITNGGRTADALKNVGLSASALVNMPLSDRMNAVADAMTGLETPAQRAQLAFDLFGRNGMKMTEVLAGGSAALEQAQADVIGFGVALSDIEARQVEQAGDAMTAFGLASKGVGNQLSVVFAPILEGIGNAFADSARKTGGFREEIETAFNVGVAVAGAFADALRYVGIGFDTIIAGAYASNLALEEVLAATGQGSAGAVALAKHQLQSHLDEMNELITSEMPSDKIQKIIGQWQADSLTGATNGVDSAPPALGFVSEDADSAKEQEKQAQKLEKLRESLLTEEEAENESYLNRLNQLQTYYDNEMLTQGERNSMKEKIESQHMDNMKKIRQSGEMTIAKFEAMSYKDRAKTVFGELQSLTQGVAQHSRSMFEINKVAGIANAVISTYEGVTKTLAAYPAPYNLALAGVVAAAGFAQVAAIKSTTFNGGGGGAAPSLSGSTGGAPVTEVGGGGGSQSRNLDVTLNGVGLGDLFSGKQVKDLIGKINEQIEDGATIRRISFS